MRLNAEDEPSRVVAISTPCVMYIIDPDSARSLSPGRTVTVAICDSSPSIFDDTAKSIGTSFCAGLAGRLRESFSSWRRMDDGGEENDSRDSRS
ncbi:unnamed protein product [Pseudo-nitzschia multistriata]|uniref:Uncharacterized protein n=1 Tax=Pseudo-nitzschia multistriata TaxID=183589 RepID=A0A448ZRN5_9STRA|nr:unnamed protein product [Pseudo-nitzschia multistriata]